MSNFFTKLFGSTDDVALGIDIGASAIKIVQCSRKGDDIALDTYGSIALGPYGDGEIGKAITLPINKTIQALTDVLREAKTTTKRCGFSIPISSSLISVIQMPDVDEAQLSKMIPIEARKYIPVPISEVMLDWSIIPHGEKETYQTSEASQSTLKYTDVLLVAIHKEVLTEYGMIVDKSGLESDFFEIEMFSLIRSVLSEQSDPVMILDFGSASTKLFVVEKGIIRNSHTINRGSQDITKAIMKSRAIPYSEAEVLKREKGLTSKDNDIKNSAIDTFDYIFSETNRVLFSYKKRYNKSIESVVLAGGGAVLKGFEDLAKEKLNVAVSRGQSFSKIKTPAFLEGVLKETGPEFATACGLALRVLSNTQ